MRLNTLSPGAGAKTVSFRVGRGIGSGMGKTCGKGHKGQKARAGGYHRRGFEGGQMPMQRRIPKSGFRSLAKLLHEEIRLSQLNGIDSEIIDFAALRQAGIIKANTKTVKVLAAGKIDKAVNLRGIRITKGAREAIIAAGGTVE